MPRVRLLYSLPLLCAVAMAASSGPVPVVVELFTSEGCSSCPPADAVLAKLVHSQPVPEARIIALSEHVDYWNNLGWVDPFSSPQFRARQSDFARAFRVDDVYTPQMIVNGRVQFVGNDYNRALTEIGHAASQPAATVVLGASVNHKEHDLVDLSVLVRNLPAVWVSEDKKAPAPVQVLLAVTEDNLTSDVARGENTGRRLRHVAVVRSFGVIGKLDPRDQTAFSLHPTLKLPGSWKRQDLHAVVFVEERATQRIIGAESLDLN